jgi:hypothetical protein
MDAETSVSLLGPYYFIILWLVLGREVTSREVNRFETL